MDLILGSSQMTEMEAKRFRIQSFGEEEVVFDCLSGDTHYLNPVARSRLEGFTLAQIAEKFPEVENAELNEIISAVDKQFREWGMSF